MSRRLTLNRYGLEQVQLERLGAFALKMEAVDDHASGADPNIFLFDRRPPNPGDGTIDDVFLAVASPADMAEYPVGEPNDRTTYPIFRVSSVTLLIRNTALALEAWKAVIGMANVLLLALDRFDDLVLLESVDINPSGIVDESVSSSSSVSL